MKQEFTFTFTTIQARLLYEAYVLGSVSILKGQPQHRELHALLFTNSVWVL